MPELNSTPIIAKLEAMSPDALHLRRVELRDEMLTKHKGFDDPNIPEELLHELAAITALLRRKSAGPPKAPKGSKPLKKGTTDDLLSQL